MSQDPRASAPPAPFAGLPKTPLSPLNPAPVVLTPAALVAEPAAIQVKAGAQMPPTATVVPQLVAQQAMPTEGAAGNSAIASGMRFEGNAVVQSGCVIAGSVVGNIAQAPGVQIHITVTETGDVRGDIKAHQIIVMGRTQGLLDASAGLVTLHESANVQGHVRYAKLQVNGAELNATLEKSTPTISNGR